MNLIEEVSLVGPFSVESLLALPRNAGIASLSLTLPKVKRQNSSKRRGTYQVLSEAVARGFEGLTAVETFWLWLEATPAALRQVFAIPGLRVLDLLGIAPPGRLSGFASAPLEQFRCNGGLGLREKDLIEIATSTSLKMLGAHHCKLSLRAVGALMTMPRLESLDIEGSNFDDAMAALVSNGNSLRSLELCATQMSAKGLAHLCTMKQLRSLDLWQTNIREYDLDLLAGMPLEYLSVGNVPEGNKHPFSADIVLKKLEALPKLKRVWLDGVELNAEHLAELKKRKISVRLT